MGILMEDLSTGLRNQIRLNGSTSGVAVREVIPNSPADQADSSRAT